MTRIRFKGFGVPPSQPRFGTPLEQGSNLVPPQRSVNQADFFSHPTKSSDKGMGGRTVAAGPEAKDRMKILPIPCPLAGTDAFAENKAVPPVLPCECLPTGKSLPSLLDLLHKSIGFHFLGRIRSCGMERPNRETVFPARPMSRRKRGGAREAENRLHGSVGRARSSRISKPSRREPAIAVRLR